MSRDRIMTPDEVNQQYVLSEKLFAWLTCNRDDSPEFDQEILNLIASIGPDWEPEAAVAKSKEIEQAAKATGASVRQVMLNWYRQSGLLEYRAFIEARHRPSN